MADEKSRLLSRIDPLVLTSDADPVPVIRRYARRALVVRVFVDPKAAAARTHGRTLRNPERHGAGSHTLQACGHATSLGTGRGNGVFALDGEHRDQGRDLQNPQHRLRWVPDQNRPTVGPGPVVGHDEDGQARRIDEEQMGQIKDDLHLSLLGQGDEAVSQLRRSGQVELALHRDDDTVI